LGANLQKVSQTIGISKQNMQNNREIPRYGYEFLAVENNEVLNGHLNLTEVPIKYSNCYFASFGEELAETL